jgi:hypothetical protein
MYIGMGYNNMYNAVASITSQNIHGQSTAVPCRYRGEGEVKNLIILH